MLNLSPTDTLIENELELIMWYRDFGCSAEVWIDLCRNHLTKDFSSEISSLIFSILTRQNKSIDDFKEVNKLYEDINFNIKRKSLRQFGKIIIMPNGGFYPVRKI